MNDRPSRTTRCIASADVQVSRALAESLCSPAALAALTVSVLRPRGTLYTFARTAVARVARSPVVLAAKAFA